MRTLRTNPWSGALVALLWLVPVGASAQSRALLVSHELEPGVTRALSEALARSLEVEVVTPTGLRERLERSATELGDDAAATRRDAALERARTAYVQLQLGRAREAYEAALETSLASDRGAAEPAQVAQIVFERALVALASQQQADADADFVVAATIDPELAPDRDVYGDPVLRAFDRARRRARRGRARRLHVERAPADATVTVNGRVVEGAQARVRGDGPHLVTATRPGYVPRSMLVRADGASTEVGVVLAEAEGPALARDALAAWPAEGAIEGVAAELVARAAGVQRIVEASRDGDVVRLVLHAPGSAEPLRSAEGARRSWEPQPFHVLAEALAGRVVQAPPVEPDRAPVSLAVSAPERVTPGESFALALRVQDPDGRLRRLRGECGALVAERRLDEARGARDVRLDLEAPDEETELPCLVVGEDVMGEAIVRFPSPDESLLVAIRPEGGDDGVAIGLTIGAIALALGAAIAVGAYFALNPNQVLVPEVSP